MRRESLLYDLTNGLFGVHPIFYASNTYRATWCIHLSALPSPLAVPRELSRFPSGPTFESQALSRLHSRPVSSLFLHGPGPCYYELRTRIQPSLLAGLLNGYNLALFTTRAARSPARPPARSPPRCRFDKFRRGPVVSFWKANRRRSAASLLYNPLPNRKLFSRQRASSD